jgi:hypothetical protein
LDLAWALEPSLPQAAVAVHSSKNNSDHRLSKVTVTTKKTSSANWPKCRLKEIDSRQQSRRSPELQADLQAKSVPDASLSAAALAAG